MTGQSARGRGAKPARAEGDAARTPAGQQDVATSPQQRSAAARRSPSPEPIRLGDLYRGHGRLGLIRDLAFGEFSHAEIARSLGGDLTGRDIAAFADDYADEILEVRAALAGQLAIETAGLWISKRQNRLAELQSDVEDLNHVILAMRESGRLGGKMHHDTVKVKIAALRAAADELTPRGLRMTSKQDDEDKNVVHYVIEAEDGSDITGSLT